MASRAGSRRRFAHRGSGGAYLLDLRQARDDGLLADLPALSFIGERFPDTDEAYAGADSVGLLRHVLADVRSLGYRIEHIDAVIHAQRPKLKPYKRAMRENLAEALGIDVAAINLKAKTGEGLGPVGEGLAMSAQVIVQLVG